MSVRVAQRAYSMLAIVLQMTVRTFVGLRVRTAASACVWLG